MKLIYVFHSCYAILSDTCTIIIDFYKDSDKEMKGVVYNELLKREGDLYVLSTHSHHDHYNPVILDWAKARGDIKYIFSREIKETLGVKGDKINYLDKLDSFKDKNIEITAFGSTDAGGSFLIKHQGKIIFHAGDLNNWHWNEESTKEEIEEAEGWYRLELNLLASKVSEVDLAMFPIDPRLGKDYMKGAEQFISKIKVDKLAPMHCQEQYDKANTFETIATKYGTEFLKITNTNQNFNF